MSELKLPPSDPLVIRGGDAFRRGSGLDETTERRLFQSLCGFLNRHGLSSTELPTSDTHDWERFELRKSHLNELGWQVVLRGLDRWLANIDRGGSEMRTVALERALKDVSSSRSVH